MPATKLSVQFVEPFWWLLGILLFFGCGVAAAGIDLFNPRSWLRDVPRWKRPDDGSAAGGE